ncbi:MAG: class F sortase, partial [Acidimicrobiia bacterium]
AAGLLTGSAAASGDVSAVGTPPAAPRLTRTVAAALPIPAPLVDPGIGLRAGPAAVALELALPSLGVRASVTGVGITRNNVMDAPTGAADDPIWQQAFWYRGSAVPGALSTALIAGHIDGPRGLPAVFAHLDLLRPGDPVVVRDTRTGLDVRFAVTGTRAYTLEETTHPDVLREIYGRGPVEATTPQESADGLAHLTLITCAGTFRDGTHDHRLVVSATRTA